MKNGTSQAAVLDRIVDDVHAVLLVGPDELERIVPKAKLPTDAKEGMWFQVVFDGDELVSIVIDEEATDDVRRRILSKMEKLRRRGR